VPFQNLSGTEIVSKLIEFMAMVLLTLADPSKGLPWSEPPNARIDHSDNSLALSVKRSMIVC
jgi:hypothetical protein